MDPTDHRAALAGLPPIDAIDVWPHLSGASPGAPRTEVPLGTCEAVASDPFCQGGAPGAARVGGLVAAVDGSLWKLLVGTVALDCVTGPVHPNATLGWDAGAQQLVGLACPSVDCGNAGCLYNLTADETEGTNLNPPGQPPTGAVADVLGHLQARLHAHNSTCFSPDRGAEDLKGACAAALGGYGGTWGPWLR